MLREYITMTGMAVLPAGAARYRYQTQLLRRRLLLALAIVVVLAALIVVAHAMLAPKAASTPPPQPAQPKLGFEAKQVVDVNLVAAAVGQYAAANGALPTHLSVGPDGGLVLCGAACDPAMYTIGGFDVYQASSIKLMAYAPGLTAPDQHTMYLVPGAKCGTDGQLGAVNPTPRSMAILYAGVVSGGTKPRCVVL